MTYQYTTGLSPHYLALLRDAHILRKEDVGPLQRNNAFAVNPDALGMLGRILHSGSNYVAGKYNIGISEFPARYLQGLTHSQKELETLQQAATKVLLQHELDETEFMRQNAGYRSNPVAAVLGRGMDQALPLALAAGTGYLSFSGLRRGIPGMPKIIAGAASLIPAAMAALAGQHVLHVPGSRIEHAVNKWLGNTAPMPMYLPQMHADPGVLLREINNVAHDPALSEAFRRFRMPTGEYALLKNLGITYGKSYAETPELREKIWANTTPGSLLWSALTR